VPEVPENPIFVSRAFQSLNFEKKHVCDPFI
jgi:hypothetical protein